jgi:flagella basal body P-ring formation protein FlgA
MAASSPSGALQTAEGQFAEAVRAQIARRMKLPESHFDVRVERLDLMPAVDTGNLEIVQILGLGTEGSQRVDGLFSVPVTIRTSAGLSEVRATGILAVNGPVYVSRHALKTGDVLAAMDLDVARMSWRSLPTGAALRTPTELVGLRVRQALNAGSALHLGQLEEAPAVRAGETIEITLISGNGVLIRTRAIARAGGKIGDVIRVEQPDTQKTLSVVVSGLRKAEVRL